MASWTQQLSSHTSQILLVLNLQVFSFHTMKPLQNDLSSNVDTRVLQIQETIQ